MAQYNESEYSKLRGRYAIKDLIAEGGMAAVYRAYDEFLGRDVAVKVFRASATAETDFKRQEDEVNVLARLNHSNLVTLLDAAVDRTDHDNPRIYYVMELVQGTDLKRRLAEGTLSARQIAQLGYSVAIGLEHVHGHGIVHRDVKPANILITTSADSKRIDAKLGDFGIASVGNAAAIADDEIVTGTVAYLSPEQARGDEVGPASDLYSLGLVLLQCFTGELAFPGPPQHSAMARLLDDPAIPDIVPEEWVPLLRAMTSREAADRPDVHDVAIALRQMFAAETGRHKADTPAHEQVEAATRHEVLDSAPDETFDRITAFASRVLSVPVAIVTVVDHDRVWSGSQHGIEVAELGQEIVAAAASLRLDEPLVIENATSDPRADSNALLAVDPGLQFYAGVPLHSHDGHYVGTLNVLDFVPRRMSNDDLATLQDLAAMVMRELDLRREAQQLLQAESTWNNDQEESLITNSPSVTSSTGPVEFGASI